MRRVINSTYISLDGVVEQPRQWPTIERPPDGRSGQMHTDLLMAGELALTGVDVVIVERRASQDFLTAEGWAQRTGWTDLSR